MYTWPFNFSVIPRVPEKIQPLRDLAYNLWWCWNDRAVGLFRRLDPALWEVCGHNPVRLLRRVRQSRLAAAAADEDFCRHLDEVNGQLQEYLNRKDRWHAQAYPDSGEMLTAYFSAEFGFHESLPIYSGGLGILAGDHCKSASDLGVPFVAVGLLYRLGYFKQKINRDGWQESESITWDFYELPIEEVRLGEGAAPLLITVQMPGRVVHAKVWEVKIGRVKLYLLDTDVPENSDEDRKITYQLYGGDHEMRIKQEIVLGIGGVRAIEALGLKPTVYHMNEGHAAFLSLERIRRLVSENSLNFLEALQAVAASTLFTTHTPVAAGNDAFNPELVGKYFGGFIAECGIGFEEFLKFGRTPDARPNDPFSMTVLALRMSRYANGVSAIHGGVSRAMWQSVWPGLPKDEVPIGHVTNGIHTLTWMAPEIRALLEREGGVFWETHCSDKGVWKCSERIPDGEFWNIKQQLKLRLIKFARSSLRYQRLRAGYSAEEIVTAEDVLDPGVLTIGFARRFATYKRAALLFRDLKRLENILNHPQHPVQFLFAGKAHPADEEGKKLIQKIYQVAELPQFRKRIVFIENYDMHVARQLYHGVDVWLNNPTRPLEASGTSGEKVAPNGGINLSVRDGWWDEAYNGENGWAIGEEITSADPHIQDEFDAVSLYNLLEHKIAPLYYRRNDDGIPHEWIRWMRNSLQTISPEYNTSRMVQDYTNKYYQQASAHGRRLSENKFNRARKLAEWKAHIRKAWPDVKAKDVSWRYPQAYRVMVGDEFQVECKVALGNLKPEEVLVEVCVQSTVSGSPSVTFPLLAKGPAEAGWVPYTGTVKAHDTGSYHFNVRLVPTHPDLTQKFEMRLITWAI
jgi:starch phosphorylase